MKPSNVVDTMIRCVKARQSLYVTGHSGIGKSDCARQAAQALANGVGLEFTDDYSNADTARHYVLYDIRAALLDAVDLRGIPHIHNGMTCWAPPIFLPRAGQGIIFIDELSSAVPTVQNALLQLIRDRRLGELRIPDGYGILAAGNLSGDGHIYKIGGNLSKRFLKITMEHDVEDWVSWALKNGIRTDIIAFIRFRPALLLDGDACPRTWTYASAILDTAPPQHTQLELISGCVGGGPAAEFIAFARIMNNLVSPDRIIMAPDTADVPTDPATLYAICGCLARRASQQTFPNIVKYAGRLPAEYSVLLVRDCLRVTPGLDSTRAFITWASDHKDILI